MIETEDLVLKKVYNTLDAEIMHLNFMGETETAKHMLWRPTSDSNEAIKKLTKWISYQKDHLHWFVYEKASNEPIGFFSIEKLSETKYGEIGICIGTKFIKKGYGTQIMKKMLDYVRNLGATEVEYSHDKDNTASQKLAEKLGFKYIKTTSRIRPFDNKKIVEIVYLLTL